MNFCLKSCAERLFAAAKRSTVKGSVSFDIGIFENPNAALPQASLKSDRSFGVKTLALCAGVAVALCFCRRIKS